MLCDSVYGTSMKWHTFRDGGQTSDCQGLRRGWGGRKEGEAVKGQQRAPCGNGIFCVRTALVSSSVVIRYRVL